MTLSRQLARDMLNRLVGKSTTGLETNSTLYVALSTTTPQENGTGVSEPAGNGYSRKAIATAGWNDATNTDPSKIDNAQDEAFPQASGGSWGLLIACALYDAPTGGAFLGHGTINGGNGLQIDDGDTAEFKAGDLAITLT